MYREDYPYNPESDFSVNPGSASQLWFQDTCNGTDNTPLRGCKDWRHTQRLKLCLLKITKHSKKKWKTLKDEEIDHIPGSVQSVALKCPYY